jgi:hypothetical protein
MPIHCHHLSGFFLCPGERVFPISCYYDQPLVPVLVTLSYEEAVSLTLALYRPVPRPEQEDPEMHPL